MMMGMGLGLFGLLLMLLAWGLLIALAVWLISALFPGTDKGSTSSLDESLSAREILERRYARGEINREQYELMKQDLA
jgi:putative membrane protein